MAFFTNDKDRKVKVFNNGVAVSSSNAQSEYARYLNFKENFTITENTISGNKVYDIVGKGYAIPQEGGVAQGSTNRPLNFNDAQFDIVETVGSPGSYDITSTGRVKVNAISTIRPLSVINSGTDDAVTVTDNPSSTDVIELKYKNDQAAVFSNGTQVGSRGRRLNFTGATITEDTTTNNYFTVALGRTLPDGNNAGSRKWGDISGGTFDGAGLFTGLKLYYDSGSSTALATELTATDIYSVFSSDNVDAELAGFSTFGKITRRDYNPYLKIKFKCNVDTEDLFIGLLDDTVRPTNAAGGTTSPIQNKTGIVLGYDDTDTNYLIWWNNGAATAQTVDTGISRTDAGVVHTLEITLTNTGTPTVNVKLDGVQKVNNTTVVPAATTAMAVHASMESVGGTVTPFALRYGYILQDV